MPVPVRPRSAERRLLRDVVFDRLFDAIVSGTLRPGEVLRDAEIEAWSGASRTPVREAIDRLAGLGFVVVRPQRETRVSDVDLERVAQMVDTLGALYEGVVRDAVPLLTGAQADEVRQLAAARTAATTRADAVQAVGGMLEVLVRAYGNIVVMEVRDTLVPHVRRAMALCEGIDLSGGGAALDDLVLAVGTRDPDAAAEATGRYVAGLSRCVREHAAQQAAATLAAPPAAAPEEP